MLDRIADAPEDRPPMLNVDQTAQALSLAPDELRSWTDSAAGIDVGQLLALASLAGARAGGMIKLVKFLLDLT